MLTPDESFRTNFCNGLGGQTFSMDQQCGFAFGSGSVRFTGPTVNNENKNNKKSKQQQQKNPETTTTKKTI